MATESSPELISPRWIPDYLGAAGSTTVAAETTAVGSSQATTKWARRYFHHYYRVRGYDVAALEDDFRAKLAGATGYRSRTCEAVLWPADYVMAYAAGSAAGWRNIEREINRFAILQDDWDAMDGIAPPARVIAGIKDFAAQLKRAGAPTPTSAYVVGDGEVGIRWKKVDGFASASFLSDGFFVAYARGTSLDAPYSLEAVWDSKPGIESFINALRLI